MTSPKALILCSSSVVILILGVILTNYVPEAMVSTFVGLVFLLHAILISAGMGIWAGAKGYSPFIGIALGFFCTIPGLVILLFLPDKNPRTG